MKPDYGFIAGSDGTLKEIAGWTLVLLVITVCWLLTACCGARRPPPKIGDQFSCSGHYDCYLKEQTTQQIKWVVQDGFGPQYYVTCDSSNRVVAIWAGSP